MIYTAIFRQGHVPLTKYKIDYFNTEQEALEYAKKLARKYPGSMFGVCKTIYEVYCRADVTPTIDKFVPEEEETPWAGAAGEAGPVIK